MNYCFLLALLLPQKHHLVPSYPLPSLALSPHSLSRDGSSNPSTRSELSWHLFSYILYIYQHMPSFFLIIDALTSANILFLPFVVLILEFFSNWFRTKCCATNMRHKRTLKYNSVNRYILIQKKRTIADLYVRQSIYDTPIAMSLFSDASCFIWIDQMTFALIFDSNKCRNSKIFSCLGPHASSIVNKRCLHMYRISICVQ